jgi:peptide-methionine (S)-S-oxide reductase
MFWHIHNQTTPSRQGNGLYSILVGYFLILMKNKKRLQRYQKKFEKECIYNNPIVTEITPFKNFYPAQNYHNDYYDKHYDLHCNVVIDHKIAKLFQKEEYNHYEMEHNRSVRVDLQKHVY